MYLFLLPFALAVCPTLFLDCPAPPRAVAFDFDMPVQEGKVDLAVTIEFATGAGEPWRYNPVGPILDCEDAAFSMCENLLECGVKAERVNKTQVRVLGIVKDGKLYPAVKGTVTSRTLKPDELPKVKNPMKP